jgi:hypothetical protein
MIASFKAILAEAGARGIGVVPQEWFNHVWNVYEDSWSEIADKCFVAALLM